MHESEVAASAFCSSDYFWPLIILAPFRRAFWMFFCSCDLFGYLFLLKSPPPMIIVLLLPMEQSEDDATKLGFSVQALGLESRAPNFLENPTEERWTTE